MSFNPDLTKQAHEIIFSRKKNATTHPPLFFNNSEIKLSSNQKHLGLTLDSKLSFNEHIFFILLFICTLFLVDKQT